MSCFKTLANHGRRQWGLTGAVTFYESPVSLLGCRFINLRAEDALNVVRTTFTLDRVSFSGTASDAFDADFTEGVIKNSRFHDCTNDAIDVSGSSVEIRNVRIEGVGDKGISIGEDSRAHAEQIQIERANIGIASKDMSQITCSDVQITDTQYGFTIYQKKSEFGPGNVVANQLRCVNVDTPYLVEKRSRLMVDGETVPADQRKVFDLLYPEEQQLP